MADDEIFVRKPKGSCCLESTVLASNRRVFNYMFQHVALSPNGRYIYLAFPGFFLRFDSIDCVERRYDAEKAGSMYALLPMSNNTAVGIFFGPKRSFVIEYLNFDPNSNAVDTICSTSFPNYTYMSSFLDGNRVGILVCRELETNLYENRCLIVEYERGRWSTQVDISLGRRTENFNVHVYSFYPTVFDGQLYTFLADTYLHPRMEEYLEALGNIQRVDLRTSAKQLQKTTNDPRCVQMREQILRSRMNGNVPMSRYHSWCDTNLFISWGINYRIIPYESGSSQRFHMHYLINFNLITLTWRSVHVERMSPMYYEIPLKALITEDNVLVLLRLRTTDQAVCVKISHAPMPIKKPHSLTRLAQLTVLVKLRAIGSSAFGERSTQILSILKTCI